MEAAKANSKPLTSVLWLLALLLVIVAFVARSSPALSHAVQARFGAAGQTVLPAKIEPVAQFEIAAEYGGTVQQVQLAAGSLVQSGSTLMVLENAELAAEALAASRRLEVAALRLRMANSKNRPGAVEREYSQIALQDHAAAVDRFNNHSLVAAERAASNSRKRAAEVRGLAGQGLATASEVENAQVAEAAASRDLDAAREHRSRLKQEVAQAESRLRLVQMQSPEGQGPLANYRSEYEEAQAAVTVTQERMNRLRISAPGEGTIIELHVREGERVSPGRRLARIADLASITVSAPVSAQVAQSVSPGQRVRVRLPLDPPREIEARLSEVTRVPDVVHQTYFIRVVVRNPEPSSVLVGLEAEMQIDHRD
jgi:membrane fusion protein (multidrug efflux system)